MTTNVQYSYGALERGSLPPRLRSSRNDAEYLFSNPVNAARLRRAIDDSRAGRNMIPVTLTDLEGIVAGTHRLDTLSRSIVAAG